MQTNWKIFDFQKIEMGAYFPDYSTFQGTVTQKDFLIGEEKPKEFA